jgi:hypothetical protein
MAILRGSFRNASLTIEPHGLRQYQEMSMSSMNRLNITKTGTLVTCLLLTLSLGACASTRVGVQVGRGKGPTVSSKSKGGPPEHAPAHGYRAKHAYRYYPGAYVYFDLDREVYFYIESGHWKVTSCLPRTYYQLLGDYVMIEMESDRPYTEHKKHKKKYPPDQIKKKHDNWAKKNKQDKWAKKNK